MTRPEPHLNDVGAEFQTSEGLRRSYGIEDDEVDFRHINPSHPHAQSYEEQPIIQAPLETYIPEPSEQFYGDENDDQVFQ